jgi:hypothetical protein
MYYIFKGDVEGTWMGRMEGGRGRALLDDWLFGFSEIEVGWQGGDGVLDPRVCCVELLGEPIEYGGRPSDLYIPQ